MPEHDTFNLLLEQEKIIGVATKLQNADEVTFLSMPPPNRHHDLILQIKKLRLDDPGPQAQGFVTNHGRWVDRVEAAKIARDAKQVMSRKRCDPQNELFSEDLYTNA